MRCSIAHSQVRFYLDNAARSPAMHQDFAQAIASHFDGRPRIEIALQQLRRS
jgi:hypothetical protein